MVCRVVTVGVVDDVTEVGVVDDVTDVRAVDDLILVFRLGRVALVVVECETGVVVVVVVAAAE